MIKNGKICCHPVENLDIASNYPINIKGVAGGRKNVLEVNGFLRLIVVFLSKKGVDVRNNTWKLVAAFNLVAVFVAGFAHPRVAPSGSTNSVSSLASVLSFVCDQSSVEKLQKKDPLTIALFQQRLNELEDEKQRLETKGQGLQARRLSIQDVAEKQKAIRKELIIEKEDLDIQAENLEKKEAEINALSASVTLNSNDPAGADKIFMDMRVDLIDQSTTFTLDKIRFMRKFESYTQANHDLIKNSEKLFSEMDSFDKEFLLFRDRNEEVVPCFEQIR